MLGAYDQRAMPPELDSFRQKVRQILLNDWDPSNAARFEAAYGEYDSYVEPIVTLLRAGATEPALMDYLHARELECMCFPPAGKAHLRRVARKLLSLDTRPRHADGSAGDADYGLIGGT